MTIHHYNAQSMRPIPDTAGEWQGLKVQNQNGDLNEDWLLRIRQLVQDALSDNAICHGLYVYQFSLMVGSGLDAAATIDRFINRFARQFQEDLERKSRLDNRLHYLRIRCLWMRDPLVLSEWDYRLLIIIPVRAYQSLCEPWKGNVLMQGRLIEALMFTLNCSFDQAAWRIAPLEFPRLKFSTNAMGLTWEYQKLFYLASIYASAQTAKEVGLISFGCRMV